MRDAGDMPEQHAEVEHGDHAEQAAQQRDRGEELDRRPDESEPQDHGRTEHHPDDIAVASREASQGLVARHVEDRRADDQEHATSTTGVSGRARRKSMASSRAGREVARRDKEKARPRNEAGHQCV